MPAPSVTQQPGRCARVIVSNEHAPHAARSFVRAVFGDRAEDVLMVTDELVSNAVEHAKGSLIAVCFQPVPEGVLVEVADQSGVPPRPRDAGDYEDSGRGLTIVDALSVRWAWARRPFGKVVWAVVAGES